MREGGRGRRSWRRSCRDRWVTLLSIYWQVLRQQWEGIFDRRPQYNPRLWGPQSAKKYHKAHQTPRVKLAKISDTWQVLMKRKQEEAFRERRVKEMKEELATSQRSLQAALLERDARKNQLVTKIKEGKVCSKL